MITILGGSFTRFHKGHQRMLDAAVATGNHIIVGLTTDDYLKSHKAYGAPGYNARKRRISEYLSRKTQDFEIQPLESGNGNAETNPEYGCIVVSPETRRQAERINAARTLRGLKELQIITVPMVLAEDLFPISSSRIMAGEIRPSGSRVNPVSIGISTMNPLKVMGLEKFVSRIMKNYRIVRNEDYSLASFQPFSEDTVSYAVKRSLSALGSRDYGIGVESGLFRDHVTGNVLDIHVCVVVDRYSRLTIGQSSGFQVPEQIVNGVKIGMTESQAYANAFSSHDPSQESGIVGILSSGKVTRMDLVYECVRNAFIPRLGPSYYGLDQKL